MEGEGTFELTPDHRFSSKCVGTTLGRQLGYRTRLAWRWVAQNGNAKLQQHYHAPQL